MILSKAKIWQIYNGKYSEAANSWLSRIGRAWEIYLLIYGATNHRILKVQAKLREEINREPPKAEGYVSDARTGKVLAPLYRLTAPVGLIVGCNSGDELTRFHNHPLVGDYLDLIGVDINRAAVAQANERLASLDQKGTFMIRKAYTASAEGLKAKTASVNVVFSRHTLEHVQRPANALEEMVRVAQPAAQIAISYPFEPIRGITAMPSAILTYGNPLMARQTQQGQC